MNDDRLPFYALYLTRFSEGFGFITLITLLPTYINLLDPSATTVLGVTLGAGFVVGMYTTGFTLAQTATVVPLAWAGDRFDKRLVLLGSLLVGVAAYALFPLVDSSGSFIAARALQGVAVTGAGLMSLSLVGQLARPGTRANYIGKANAASFFASILGSLSAGALYQALGFGTVFSLIVAVMTAAAVSLWAFLPPDETRIEGFPFADLALNRRILTITSFRVQYSFAVTLVRTWIPIYAGVSAAAGGLAVGALAVSLTVVAEKATNMVSQPYTGGLSDEYGRAAFVFVGGGLYGLVALLVPFSPAVGAAVGAPAELAVPVPTVGANLLGVPSVLVLVEDVPAALLPLVFFSGLLGVADSLREPASMALFADEGTDEGGVASSFGIRELVWRPGSVLAPLLGGYLMYEASMAAVFYVGGAFALTGVGAFLAILIYDHGAGALREW